MQSFEERADEMLRAMGGSLTIEAQRIALRRLIEAEDKVIDFQGEVRRLNAIMQVESDGAKAALTGEPLTANPWPRDTTVHNENWHLWCRGWNRAHADALVSLLECTEFALDWLTLHHVIEKEGADWNSKFDGSPFYGCDCSENGGYMEWDTNAYIHTEQCSSGFEDSLAALHDQIKQALGKS